MRRNLFGNRQNRTVLSQEKKPLKGFLKLIFSSCLGSNSSRKHYHLIKMSDLIDSLNIPKENFNSDDKYESLESDEVISINVVENTSQNKEKSNGEENKKTIKVKITIRGEEITQRGQNQMKTIDSSTPLADGKAGNRKICIIDEFEDDSLSLVLKSPGKKKTINCTNKITTPNNKRDHIVTNKSQAIEGKTENDMGQKSCESGIFTETSGKNQSEKKYDKVETNSTKQQSLLNEKAFSPLLVHNSINYIPERTPYGVKEFIEHEQRQFTPNLEQNTPLNSHKLEDTSFKRQKPDLKGVSKNFIEVEQRESTPRSKLCESKSYDSDLSIDRSNDSLIVRDIIMEHYQDVLNYFNNKSAKKDIYRRSISLADKNEKHDLTEDAVEYPLSISLHDDERAETQINKKSLDSGLHEMTTTKSTNTLKSLDQNEDQIEYDSKAFLLAALGEDLMSIGSNSEIDSNISSTPASSTTAIRTNYDTEKSVGSSQISSLVSTPDCKSGIYSLYSTVNKSSKKKTTPMKKKSVVRSLYTSSTYDHYESVEFKENSTEELNRDISTFQGIVTQALNAVNVCKNEPKLYGSIHHLEAERILLLSTWKLEMLNRQSNKYGYEEVDREQSSGTISVSGLRFSGVPYVKTEKGVTDYYLSIIQSGTTVLASNITSASKSGEIFFQNNYHFSFNTVLSELEINISVYSIRIRNKQIKNNSCFASNRKFWKSKRESNNNDSSFSEISSIQLLGNARIGVAELCLEDKFMLNNMPLYSPISETFEADIGINLRMNNKLSGFLTIRTKNILWNRRWCVLDGFLLMYWNWPAEEHERKPLKTIDLQKCITKNVSSVDKSVCSRSRTFVLELKPQEMSPSELYFLSADNLSELCQWQRQINMTLATIRLRNRLKCKTVIL